MSETRRFARGHPLVLEFPLRITAQKLSLNVNVSHLLPQIREILSSAGEPGRIGVASNA